MIPYDATQHIQGIAQGAQNAMPSLIEAGKRNQSGSPTLERFINEFEARVGAGEHPKAVGDDLMSQWENEIRSGVQHTDINVPDVGFNQGVPAVGNSGAGGTLAQPVAQYPNSFGGGSFDGLTPSASQMGGGIGGNTQPNPQPPPIQVSTAPSPQYKGGQATMDDDVASPPGMETTVRDSKPIQYEESKPIDLTAGRSKMNTGSGSTIPPMRSRGEQEQAMGDIERVKKMESGENSLQFKRDKLEMESRIKIIKGMSDRLSDKEKMDLMRTLKTEGMTTQAQIAVMDATIRMVNAENQNKNRQEANRIKANKASDKIPDALKHLWVRYTKATDEIARFQTSLDPSRPGIPERIKQLKKIAAKELHEYNLAAIEAGLPERSDKDKDIPEVYGDNDPNNKVEE